MPLLCYYFRRLPLILLLTDCYFTYNFLTHPPLARPVPPESLFGFYLTFGSRWSLPSFYLPLLPVSQSVVNLQFSTILAGDFYSAPSVQIHHLSTATTTATTATHPFTTSPPFPLHTLHTLYFTSDISSTPGPQDLTALQPITRWISPQAVPIPCDPSCWVFSPISPSCRVVPSLRLRYTPVRPAILNRWLPRFPPYSTHFVVTPPNLGSRSSALLLPKIPSTTAIITQHHPFRFQLV